MNPPSTISLDADWTCIYSDGTPHLAEMKPVRVASLSGWLPFLSDQDLSALLWHAFDLQPTDVCVRYLLHIESAPGTIKLDLNQRQGVEIDGASPFVLDVTDDVRLENNVISFQVMCGAAVTFGAVYLVQVPCTENLTIR